MELLACSHPHNPDPKMAFIVLEIGVQTMGSALVPDLQIFQGLSFFKTAVGWSCLPYIIKIVHKLPTDKKLDEVRV